MVSQTHQMRPSLKNVYRASVLIALIIITLIYFDDLLKPLTIALFSWYIVYDLKKYLAKIKIKGKSMPGWLKSTLAYTLLFLLAILIFQIISINIEQISNELPNYKEKLDGFVATISLKINDPKILDYLRQAISKINFAAIASGLVNSLTSVVSSFIVIIFYIIFMLLEETAAHKKLEKFFPNQMGQYLKVKDIFIKIDKAIQSYINSMFIVSFLTGAISYIALLVLGIDFPVLWAFLIFILNFIPYLGSIAATFLPSTIAVFQFGNPMYFIYVLSTLMVIQMILGNLVQPKLMGKSLNISPIAVLLAFAFWGSIWGITGMVLSVPITSVTLIILAQIPETRSIAILMSENGDIGE